MCFSVTVCVIASDAKTLLSSAELAAVWICEKLSFLAAERKVENQKVTPPNLSSDTPYAHFD